MTQAWDAVGRVAIRVDATPTIGVGHLVRQVALAEELAGRGVSLTFYGTCAVPFARSLLDAHGWAMTPAGPDPEAFAARAASGGITHAVLDGYELGPAWGKALRGQGLRVAALCDGTFGADQDADLYVDQNLGAVQTAVPAGRAFRGGLAYALLRDVVRSRRGAPVGTASARPRVLVVFGGTDPAGGTPVYAELLLGLGIPIEVVAVASTPERVAALETLDVGPDQTVAVVPPVADLPALAMSCDAVVTAAGSSVWELACLGVPMGLVCVVENQRLGYEQAGNVLALSAGVLDEVREPGPAREAARSCLRALVSDADLRADLARRASGLVDGRGRERVVDALLEEAPTA